jgi:phytoene synthase
MRGAITPDLAARSAATIKAGSKSFAAAARIFDRQTRASVHMLYAWCRYCDDVIDGQELGFARDVPSRRSIDTELADLFRQTNDALDGKPMTNPVFAGFQRVAETHAIPRQYPLDLLEGFAMDARATEYETIDDTLLYCYHVAGVVGVMMALVMGVRDDETLDRASDLGLAFQLTNIARDVVSDAKSGRVYLPGSWLREAGVPPGDLANPHHRKPLAAVATRLLGVADQYYRSSRVGLSSLPLRSRCAIATARRVYREIGREVARRQATAWETRISTSKTQKIAAAIAGCGTALAAPILTRASPRPRDGLWTRPRYPA